MTASVPFTEENLTTLNDALALGVLEVKFRDHMVRYQSTNQMLRLRDRMQAEIDAVATGGPVRRGITAYSRLDG